MKIAVIDVPTPFYVGSVNVYLIREDPVTLIDVGPKTPESVAALRRGLAEHGVQFADVRRIALTHAHEDHCGLAATIRDEAKDAEILLHSWESGHLNGRLSHAEDRSLLLRAGVPPQMIDEMRGLYDEVGRLTDPISPDEITPLNDGDELEFESGTLTVLHTPGHTPGSCSFFRQADRTLVCGDCILKRITPNPMLAPDPLDRSRRFRSLGEYLVTLARLRSLSPTLVYGGHGEPVTDMAEIFNRYIKAIDARQERVKVLVDKSGSTAYQVAERLFPNSIDRDVHRFLAVSEAVAHLDHAVESGRLNVEMADGVEIYRP